MSHPAEIIRRARYVAECFCDPEQFATPGDYLAALTEALSDLAAVTGHERRALPEMWIAA